LYRRASWRGAPGAAQARDARGQDGCERQRQADQKLDDQEIAEVAVVSG